jgi:hypothetical protein
MPVVRSHSNDSSAMILLPGGSFALLAAIDVPRSNTSSVFPNLIIASAAPAIRFPHGHDGHSGITMTAAPLSFLTFCSTPVTSWTGGNG